MPGIAGWWNNENREMFAGDALPLLRVNRYQKIVELPCIRNGYACLVHPDAHPAGAGMAQDAGGRMVAFWGEFYGPPFDRCRTAGEIGAALLEVLGDRPAEALDRLDGSFVLLFQDARRQLVAVDRVASRPLYYSESPDGVAFAPDLKIFHRLRGGRPAIHRDSMVAFLVNGHPLSDATYYQGVRLLYPGSYIEFAGGRITRGEYTTYTPADPRAADRGLAAYQEELAALLRAAVRKRSDSLDKTVLLISGGYDSRGLLACVREFYDGPLNTVSWGIHEDDPTADAAIGRRIAAHFGTRHCFLPRRNDRLIEDLRAGVDRTDAANWDSFMHAHEANLIESLRERGDDILIRGDECFGYTGPAVSAMEATVRVGIRELSQFPGLHGLFQPDVLPAVLAEQWEGYQRIIASCPDQENWTIAKDWLYLRQRIFRSLNFSHYAKLSVLEARNPWLDRDLFRFYSEIPVHYRYDKMLYRRTLEFMFPALMRDIPLAGRSSLENWAAVLRADRRFEQFTRDELVGSRSRIHEIWSPAGIERYLDSFYRGESTESLQTRLVHSGKTFVRQTFRPLYGLLKKAAPRQLTIRPFPPEFVIGNLLILKLWCDKWA